MLIKNPIFVIGNPRSGTTLLRLMLTTHPNIVVPPECGFVLWWYRKYRNWGIADAIDDSRLVAFVADLLKSRKIETWNIDRESLLELLGARRPKTYAELVSLVYEWYARSLGRSQATRWGDKNNYYLNHILTIAEIFSGANFVHIVRDGRDVVSSYKELAGRSINSVYAPQLAETVEDAAADWRANMKTIRDSFDILGWKRVCEMRFEDLLREPERQLRVLCNSIGENYESSMLDYFAVNRLLDLEPTEFLQWKEKTVQPLQRDVVGRYQRDLSDMEIAAVIDIAGDYLASYGYL